MVEGTNLFTNNQGGRRKSALPHMARMIGILGPPPQELLDSTYGTDDFFDKNGRPVGSSCSRLKLTACPGNLKKGQVIVQSSLEAEAKALEGNEKAEFLRFLRRMLHWQPEKRASARELLQDPWLIPDSDSDSDEEQEVA